MPMTRRFHALIVSVALLAAATRADAAGVLVPRDGSPPIQVQSQRVTAVVDDGIARTTLRQTFVNPHGRTLEAVYLFPVPEGAALVDVAMEVGGQRLEGLLVERQQARRIYDSLVRRKVDPALVEQIGREQFRLSVFPVEPGKPTLVEITWTQHVPLERGEMRYVYPLALAGSPAAAEVDFAIAVTMRSSVPLASVASSAPGAEVVRRGPNEALVTMEATAARLDADFVVTAKVDASELRLDLRTFRSAARDGWFAAVLTPPAPRPEDVLPRDVTLVVDTSGSMKGAKIEQARTAALHLLRGLRPTDRVNVATFSTAVVPFAQAPVPANEENLAKLREFVGAIEARGGTALADAVAFAAAARAQEGRVATSVLLTDGQPTVGETVPAAIVGQAKASAVRIFTFGVGADAAGDLLRGVSAASRGASEVFRSDAEIESRLRRFLDRTATPVMTDLRLAVDGVAVHEVLPRPVPDAYAGEQIVLTGRFLAGGEATVAVSARLGNREIALTRRVAFPEQPGGATTARDLHARHLLAFLEESLRLRTGLSDAAYFAALDRGAYSTADEIVAEIVAASIESGVQSPYTSFLVLLPEDRARLNPTDTAALDDALGRVRQRLAQLARSVDDPVLRDAKDSDHTAADDVQPVEEEESLGDPRFNSDAAFEGPGTNGTIGIGGGAGGAFGGRKGGHGNLRASGGGMKTRTPVDPLFDWLAARQAPDGHWEPDAADRLGPVGTTAQALLCLLGAGETHQSGMYKDRVKEALKYLKNAQDSDGCFGPRTSPTWVEDNAWAALAMIEAYGLTGSRLFKDSSERAVGFVQRPGSIYRDTPPRRLLGVIGMVLRSAKLSELTVDDGAVRELVARIDAVPEDAPAAELASAMLARVLLRPDTLTSLSFGARIDRALSEPPVAADPGRGPDAWYFPTLLAFQIGGERWRAWDKALLSAIESRSSDDPALRGSLDPPERGMGRMGTTTLGILCAEVAYRYARVAGAR